MSKVYLPTFTSNSCIVIKDKDTIRVYDSLPQFDSYATYTDYYINSHYLSKSDREFITEVPTCEDLNNYTTSNYYRNDFDNILVIFFIILIICIWFPYKIISRLFGRWLKIW